MSKKKEAKTNAMRLLDALHIPYRHYSYECREFVDARHTAEALNLAEEKMYKTLVTEGAPRQYYVFVIPIGAELSLKKAARTVGEKALSMLPVKDITAVTGYVRGGCTALGMKRKYPTVVDASAEALPEMVVSGGRLRMWRIFPFHDGYPGFGNAEGIGQKAFPGGFFSIFLVEVHPPSP